VKSAPAISPEAMVRNMYRKLARSWGQQHWWPAETPFEVIVGAILTQNTSWTNVERAIASLRAAGALSVPGIRAVTLVRLQKLVHSSGYYRQKAQRLKDFVTFLDQKHAGALETMFAIPTDQLRAELLSLKGIGPETADAILLYAGNHEIFVVDAYTRRVLERHGAVDGHASYDQVRTLVQRALQGERPLVAVKSMPPKKVPVHEPSAMSTTRRSPVSQVYNEMHGLFVQVGKHYCLKQVPRCEACPLRTLLPPGTFPL
jgi:endonuclease III related protein